MRYIHTTIHGILAQAVSDGLLNRNPADAARPPSAAEAKAPEMTCWNAAHLAVFLGWAEENSQSFPLWHFLANTGARRGESLSVRWRDRVARPVAIRIGRSAGMVRNLGEGAEVVEGDTKSGKPRVVDLKPDADEVRDQHKRDRGSLALQLVRAGALIFGDIEGAASQP